MAGRVVNGKWVELTWQEEYNNRSTKNGWKPLISLEQRYPNEEQRLNILTNKMLFENGESDFSKVMWRMSNGSLQNAFNLAQRIVGLGWGYILSMEDFEWACAIITGGCEVEWLSD